MASSPGAASTAHPRATEAALAVFQAGGNAVDAAIAAQAVLTVLMPDACGLGGDALCLVRTPGGRVTAVTGAGTTAAASPRTLCSDGGGSVTVPGIVDAWQVMSHRWGRLPLARVLAPATALAFDGMPVSEPLAAAVRAQRARLLRGGAEGWPLLDAAPGDLVTQKELARTLERIAAEGSSAFYRGELAGAVAAAVRRDGGRLTEDDLARHRTPTGPAIGTPWDGGTAFVQPSPSQGVLLAMALAWLEREGVPGPLDHVCVELTEAVFASRDRCARDGARLLDVPLEVDPERSSLRGGPRAYLHTAGVATADPAGHVVSSLVSVFDDFGSCTFVPEGGFTLNNRAGGFTAAPNDPGPARRPVHTLAPALLTAPGRVTALATPGADGQVQTLLQVLARMRFTGGSLADAVRAPRWRSEEGLLLVEDGHDGAGDLARRGHRVTRVPGADMRLGAVVAAGTEDGEVFCAGDWRRQVHAAVAGPSV
ncbi:glutamyltransferase [Sphaerisporangium krabiense]|uniref:Gamma-glutamyltranspeptidase/glutathione hydrolase n=1 Tax=Sphaerisporangium krabiense TaxID=763782 RepID=A0A7W8Z287_9ACTN|nr:gamma-glutamyltransferase [Sphaerisporangium krabiense]MBB5626089.1 gamma-glutamyltranspeptidase/glutathione hydrolase [Sphaerisporangium krabiense]GII64893.1 glutamyltransferase [Sphaerisporangium krabiense]